MEPSQQKPGADARNPLLWIPHLKRFGLEAHFGLMIRFFFHPVKAHFRPVFHRNPHLQSYVRR
jgi:hypothetical protein